MIVSAVFFSKMFTECMEKPCLLKPNQSVFKGIFHYNPLSQIKRESRKIKLKKKNDFRICLSIAYFISNSDGFFDRYAFGYALFMSMTNFYLNSSL